MNTETQITHEVTVPAPEGTPDLYDPITRRTVIPSTVLVTLMRTTSGASGVREAGYVTVHGKGRLRSGGVSSRTITSAGWEQARNTELERPEWLTTLLVDALPDGWDGGLLDLPVEADEADGGGRVADSDAELVRLQDKLAEMAAASEAADRACEKWDREHLELVATAAGLLAENRQMRARIASGAPGADSGYPPALPWMAWLDDEDQAAALDAVADAAVTHAPPAERLAAVERAVAQWRLIAEADHAQETAPAEYFVPGCTYVHGQDGYRAPELTTVFKVEYVTRHPSRGTLRAIGWERPGAPDTPWRGAAHDDFEGWVRVPAGGEQS